MQWSNVLDLWISFQHIIPNFVHEIAQRVCMASLFQSGDNPSPPGTTNAESAPGCSPPPVSRALTCSPRGGRRTRRR